VGQKIICTFLLKEYTDLIALLRLLLVDYRYNH
jgi:hypothetical protein